MKHRTLLIGIAAAAIILAAALFISAKSNTDSLPGTPSVVEVTADRPKAEESVTASPSASSDARAILAVQGMSCSGCINEIKNSLSSIDGIGTVLVDLSAGTVAVDYDSRNLQDTNQIASAISAVGYPATLQRTLSKEEIAKENSFLAERSKLYIAAVGQWEISRNDYLTELKHARNRYETIYGGNVFDNDQGKALLQRLQAQIVARLIDEGIQMQEILKAGYKLPPDTVKTEFDEFLAQKKMSRDQFDRALANSGYTNEYFMKKFINRVTIDRYIEENIFSGVTNEMQRQKLYADWYNNARLLSQVTYYDRELEAIVKSNSGGSGCGSGCDRQKANS